jgi:hypothetical protein
MKKFKVFLLMLVLMVFSLSYESCKKKPSCEEDNTGTITITNHYSESIWVDVTYSDSEFNEEVKLGIGSSKTYTMKVGEVHIWFTDQNGYDTNGWYDDWGTVTQCTDNPYTVSKKKSSAEGIAKHK